MTAGFKGVSFLWELSTGLQDVRAEALLQLLLSVLDFSTRVKDVRAEALLQRLMSVRNL